MHIEASGEGCERSDGAMQSAEYELLALQQMVRKVLQSSQNLPCEEAVQSVLQSCKLFARSIETLRQDDPTRTRHATSDNLCGVLED